MLTGLPRPVEDILRDTVSLIVPKVELDKRKFTRGTYYKETKSPSVG